MFQRALAAAYRSQDVFDFPVGTIIAKTFTIQADLRIADSRQDIIETRLLLRRKDGWKALPYTWNPGKTDAVLTVTGGTQKCELGRHQRGGAVHRLHHP